MFEIQVKAAGEARLILAYLMKQGCTYYSSYTIPDYPSWARYISVNQFKKIEFNEYSSGNRIYAENIFIKIEFVPQTVVLLHENKSCSV